MSISYTILCTLPPNELLAEPAEYLEWDPESGSGTFGALDLSLRSLEDHDPLPDPSWASRVVAVLHVEGHMTDDDHYDAFDDWSLALAEATQGAIYNPMRDAFGYLWEPDDAPAAEGEPLRFYSKEDRPPARIHLFAGRSLEAFEEDEVLGLRAARGHALESPAGTRIVWIFPSRLIRVAVEPSDLPGSVALRLHGDFREAGLPDEVVMAPVFEDDATAIAGALAERYGLPRRPRATPHYDLRSPRGPGYIMVVGRYAPGHFEAADFEGAKLDGDRALLEPLVPGKRYCVTGFLSGIPELPPAGFGGPWLRVMSIVPEPDGERRTEGQGWHPTPSPSQRGPALVLLEPGDDRGCEQLELCVRIDASTHVVALLDGMGGQKTGDGAARLSQLTLATLLEAPEHAPRLGPPVEPPAWVFHDLAAWAAWLVDRSPLPREPAALVTALGQRVAAVLEGVNLRGCAMGVGGIIAVIGRGRATLSRRGMGRAYLLRDGELRPLVYEHVIGRDPAAAGVMPSDQHWLMLSSFGMPSSPPDGEPPLELETRAGDRLIFVAGMEVLMALEDPARERLLAAVVPDVAAGMPPTPEMRERGWGVVAVDVAE